MKLDEPAFLADPHPVYAEWRRSGPVRRVRLPNGVDAWLVTRYEDARRALADPRLSKTRRSGDEPTYAAVSRHMLAADPPDHTRLRRLVAAAFTMRRIEALRPRIEEIADELLDGLAGAGHADLIDAFAFPLPIQVICELLGVPAEDRDKFRDWSTVIVGGEAYRDRAQGALAAMVGYIFDLIARRREHGGDDLLSELIRVRDAGDRLSGTELSSMVFLLLLAGHETTVNLIGNGTFLLLDRPARWAALRADPGLLPTAIEEFRTWPSGTAFTTAWARRWPGWKRRSPSPSCWPACRTCAWLSRPPSSNGARACCCAACAPCRSAGEPGRRGIAGQPFHLERIATVRDLAGRQHRRQHPLVTDRRGRVLPPRTGRPRLPADVRPDHESADQHHQTEKQKEKNHPPSPPSPMLPH